MRHDEYPGRENAPTIAVVGTLDTKSRELGELKRSLEERGARVRLIDATPERKDDGTRQRALAASGQRVAERLELLERNSEIDAVVGMGGSGNTELFCRAVRGLPFGFPKLLLSTIVAGWGDFAGPSDIVLMRSIADISGANSVLDLQIAQLAHAAVALAGGPRPEDFPPASKRAALTMMGLTTPAGVAAEAELRALGWEVVVFHANGSGGEALQSLLRRGAFDAVLDLTPTEMADEVAGGHRGSGPDRMTAGVRAEVAQVISLGGLDTVNFGAPGTVPGEFRHRVLYRHGDSVTLMRTDEAEAEAIGRRIAADIAAATAPTVVMAPLQGVSSLDAPGQPFYDPAADADLRAALREALPPRIPFVEVDAHINDPAFAVRLARTLDSIHRAPAH